MSKAELSKCDKMKYKAKILKPGRPNFKSWVFWALYPDKVFNPFELQCLHLYNGECETDLIELMGASSSMECIAQGWATVASANISSYPLTSAAPLASRF